VGLRPANTVIAGMLVQAHNASMASTFTSYIPHDVSTRHGNDVLAIIAHALESTSVMAAAGLPRVLRTWNFAGDITGTNYSNKSFWEAYAVLEFSSCGDGSKERWNVDFLMGLSQLLHAHASNPNGGIWDNIFGSIPVSENRLVIVSPYDRQTVGYENVTDHQILGAVITLQSMISRTLEETSFDPSIFVLPPGASNDDARHVMNGILPDLIANLAKVTPDIGSNYWETMLGKDLLTSQIRDRHISTIYYSLLNDFNSAMPTYALSSLVETNNQYKSVDKGFIFCEATGSGKMEFAEEDRVTYAKIQMNKRVNMSNPIFWMRPDLNSEDGMLNLEYAYTVQNYDRNPLMKLTTLGGTTLNSGDTLSSINWRASSRVLPQQGDCTVLERGSHYFMIDNLDELLTSFDYRATSTLYEPIGYDLKAIGKKSDQTPLWLVHSRKNKMVQSVQTVVGGVLTPDIPLADFFRLFRGMAHKTAESAVERLEGRMKHCSEAASDEFEELLATCGLTGSEEGPEVNLIMEQISVKSRDFIGLMEAFADALLSGGPMEPLVNSYFNALVQQKSESIAKKFIFHFISATDLEHAKNAAEEAAAEGEGVSQRKGKPSKLILIYGVETRPRVLSWDIYINDICELMFNVREEISKLDQARQAFYSEAVGQVVSDYSEADTFLISKAPLFDASKFVLAAQPTSAFKGPLKIQPILKLSKREFSTQIDPTAPNLFPIFSYPKTLGLDKEKNEIVDLSSTKVNDMELYAAQLANLYDRVASTEGKLTGLEKSFLENHKFLTDKVSSIMESKEVKNSAIQFVARARRRIQASNLLMPVHDFSELYHHASYRKLLMTKLTPAKAGETSTTPGVTPSWLELWQSQDPSICPPSDTEPVTPTPGKDTVGKGPDDKKVELDSDSGKTEVVDPNEPVIV